MKRMKFLLLLLPAFCLTSCNDDNESEPVYTIPEISVAYKLVNVSGSIAGVSHDFDPGTITWTFNTDETVTVVNNNTNDNVEDFFESGTYEFHFAPSEPTASQCAESIFVDDTDLGCQQVTDDGLILTQVWADGYVLSFVK